MSSKPEEKHSVPAQNAKSGENSATHFSLAPPASDTEPLSGPECIARFQKRLSGSPGVYRMYDRHGNLLYVGKARNLSNRVASYTRLNGHTNRIMRMILATTDMEFITTRTEAEALLLEANLIRKLKPRYNVLLRDDKAFPHILITSDHEAPQLLKHRGARKRKGSYFGPFSSVGSVNETLQTLQRAFLLRTCKDSAYSGRSRPCMQYQIKRCSAPCTGEISLEDYNALVREAQDFLNGKNLKIHEHIRHLMNEASEQMEYEKAAVYRDRLAALTQTQSRQGINPQTVQEADCFAAWEDGGAVCVQVFFFRNYQNWGGHAYYPRTDKSIALEETLESFIAQFYANRPCPSLVLTSHALPDKELMEEALSEKAERKVTCHKPERGEKRELVDHALSNARQALGRKLAENASHKKMLAEVARIFGLDAPPKRIEAYDNSHIQGTNAVGAMIVSGPEGFAKKHYRKFNIKSQDLTPGDDYGMMREVLRRRFSRLQAESRSRDKEAPDQTQPSNQISEDHKQDMDPLALPEWPDLLLIDGGAGQLSAAREVMDELGIKNVALVGIAKGPDRNAGRETFYMAGHTPFMLGRKEPVLYLVQRLRDEVHRFAIGTHRTRRKNAMEKNPLDDVPGIGPKRKRALLGHFGSARAVTEAGLKDLTAVPGVSESMARTIYDFFHEE